ncbi:DUF4167 domain-containing protein [Actibacterium sp. XHP0104]|uniref:DUF4167 domain-containing protein n=1 Tax=Actibacterium sp. XHP0104 TaxID=2984335 RepID=UPI0021E6E524|nr:DUF4167 domain-containing protein [Actibacterium sp. XHP0104]MCV2880792.1 DUF4167 domain-containing protein [Actibacterium sp. XHP0104]
MRSSKSRSRSKSNRSRSVGNIVNRVFDSSGPEGKVRGTPQQIIEKYNQLARDAQLANDRVAAENFQQHAEHYTRLLGEAQREMDARREQQEAQQNRDRPNQGDDGNQRADMGEQPKGDALDVADTGSDSGDSGLVETPEQKPVEKPAPRRRARKPKAQGGDDQAEKPAGEPQAPAAE